MAEKGGSGDNKARLKEAAAILAGMYGADPFLLSQLQGADPDAGDIGDIIDHEIEVVTGKPRDPKAKP